MTRRAAPLLPALLAALAYLSALDGEFTNWDDRALALAEPASQSLGWDSITRAFRAPVGKAYLPLRTLSYALDHALYGQRAWGYHLTNLLLHAANAALAFAVCSRLFASRRVGMLASVLFALHPIQTESVAWVAGRRDVLSTLFYLGAMAWYLRAVRRGERGLAAAGLLLLACLSKGTSVALPAVALVVECFWSEANRKRLLTRQAGAWLVAAAMVAIHVSVGRSQAVTQPYHGGDFLGNLATSSKAFTRYFDALALPVHLCARHHFPPTHAALWLLVPGVFGAATLVLLTRRRWRLAGICMAWFAIGLAPVSGVVFPLSRPYAERYLYVPGLGLLMLAAASCRRRAAWLLAAAVAMSAMTMERTFDWRTSETLWRSAMTVHPHGGAIAEGLLFTHLEDGNSHAALAVTRLMRSTDADPFFAQLQLAQALSRVGDHIAARGHAVDAIVLRPSDAEGYVVAADIERSLGDVASAKQFFEKALALEPDCLEAHLGLGIIHEPTQPRVALKHYQAAAQADPESAPVQYNLGNVLSQLRYYGLAEEAYRAAIAADPHHAQAHCNLGVLFMKKHDVAQATREFRRAVELDPALPQAHFHLALIDEALGKKQTALRRLEWLLRQHPDLREVRAELERIKAGNHAR